MAPCIPILVHNSWKQGKAFGCEVDDGIRGIISSTGVDLVSWGAWRIDGYIRVFATWFAIPLEGGKGGWLIAYWVGVMVTTALCAVNDWVSLDSVIIEIFCSQEFRKSRLICCLIRSNMVDLVYDVENYDSIN